MKKGSEETVDHSLTVCSCGMASLASGATLPCAAVCGSQSKLLLIHPVHLLPNNIFHQQMQSSASMVIFFDQQLLISLL